MIRLPPSVIALGPSDLKGFETRHRQAIETESVKQHFARFKIGAQDGPGFGCAQKHQMQFRAAESQFTEEIEYDYQLCALDAPLANAPAFDRSFASDGQGEARPHGLPDPYSCPGNADLLDEMSAFLSRMKSPENASPESQQPSSPSKEDFYYGGFLETPTQNTADDTLQRSSPFAPEDISTPQNLLSPGIWGIHTRMLPRSPLFRSQTASSPPEKHPTSSFTPRVASRVAVHSTPGLMFGQPARRPNHRFRHQTNSFSFDESERASAAYEQDRVSSISTNDSTPHPSGNLSLHDELRGSSLQSSRVPSGVSLPPPGTSPGDEKSAIVPPDYEMQYTGGEFIFSSPHLPLPPPFSTISRSVSSPESLPSSPVGTLPNLRTSPVKSPSTSPSRSRIEGAAPTRLDSFQMVEAGEIVRPSLPSIGGPSPRNTLRSAPRLFQSSRTSSSLGRYGSTSHLPPSQSPSTTPSHVQGSVPATIHNLQTPSRSYQVYNDALASEMQPQTPFQLPEARHQSRYHPSYTAPITQAAARTSIYSISNGGDVATSTPHRRVRRTHASPSRFSRGRSDSPVGLLSDGFRGLYGGRENGDEQESWVDGVRFSNADVRLWSLRDARADGRSLRETPERDEWRIGRD